MYVLLTVVIWMLFGNFQSVVADYSWESVFKVYSYDFNENNGIYELQSYWSAVYLWNNLLLTNDHVLTDSEGNNLGYYEVCETIDFKEWPRCFSAWKLLYSDPSKDLALLKLSVSPVTQKAVTFSQTDLEIGEEVKTYWYPSNWWNTITFTSWTISWFSSWKYKIDASIDSWSSWWWAFNDEWKLVWITTEVVSWYTTLWYIVPVTDIEDFLNKKWNITTYSWKNIDNFIKFLNKYHSNLNANSIESQHINIQDIEKYWFNIYENTVDSIWDFDNYYLESTSWNTLLEIRNYVTNTSNEIFTKDEADSLISLLWITYQSSQNIFIQWKEFYYSLLHIQWEDFIQISFSKDNVEYLIQWSMSSKDELKNALNMFFNGTTFYNNKIIRDDIQFDWLSISKKSGFSMSKFIETSWDITIQWKKTLWSGSTMYLMSKILKFEKPEEYNSLESAITSYKENSDVENNIDTDVFITNSWNIYFQYKHDAWKYMSYTFESMREVNWKLYSFNFIVLIDWAGDIDSDLKTFLNNISYSWEAVFSNTEIKENWVKNISKMEFINVKTSPSRTENNFDISEKFALQLLEELSWKVYNWWFVSDSWSSLITSSSSNLSSTDLSILQEQLATAENTLNKTATWKIYLEKLEKMIPTLSYSKLKSVSEKLKNIDLSNKKFSKYRDILIYIKVKILVELELQK